MSKKVIIRRTIRANGGLCAIGSLVTLPDRVADKMLKIKAAELPPEKKAAPPSPAKKTKAELVEICEEQGFELTGEETKKELVELLSEG